MICKSCGTLHAHGLPGSGKVEATLWLFFMWPVALVYSVWRRSAKHRACQRCGSINVVGLDTPAGAALAARYYPQGVPAAPAPPPPPRVLGAAATAAVICAPFGLFMAYQVLTGR